MIRDDQLDVNNAAGARAYLVAQIVTTLARQRPGTPLARLCAEMGILRGEGGRWGEHNYDRYTAISAELQWLKRAGKVVLVKGSGGGWRIA